MSADAGSRPTLLVRPTSKRGPDAGARLLGGVARV
ncbi:hypothetical protein J2S49_000899 [Arcanobacterium wilhelmae]|uniref:Uncharacterized protein n=1 Tax=Arcanobacterium wilhelmae TaxID=1803177 RepID=A0ABT9NBC5_9ACTO|nr:hypothetical protein [Arcanobacterium wilhelmae]